MDKVENFYSGRTVLVTGAHGFKGSWLCIILEALGARVHGFGFKREAALKLHSNIHASIHGIQFHDGDIRDTKRVGEIVKKYSPEIVFHLAAEPLVKTGFESPTLVFEVNVMGTVNLLEVLRDAQSVKSIVNVTTDKVYKNTNEEIAFNETYPLGGDDPYSASKAATEIVTHSYKKSFFGKSVGVATARAGNVIGAGDFSDSRLIPDIVRAKRKDATLEVRSPNAVRPWQHVVDPLIGYVLLARKLYLYPEKYSKPFNFGPNLEQLMSVEQLLEIIQRDLGLRLKTKIVKNFIQEKEFLALDSNLAITELGWKNTSNIVDDLKNIFDGYRLMDSRRAFIEHSQLVIMNKLQEYGSCK